MRSPSPSKINKAANKKPIAKESFTIVALGASAGGLEAITVFLQNLTSDTGMAYIYVQHLSPDHKSLLASLLANETEMEVLGKWRKWKKWNPITCISFRLIRK